MKKILFLAIALAIHTCSFAAMIMSRPFVGSPSPVKPIGTTTGILQKWSNPATWVGNRVPTRNDIVHIDPSSAILLDQNVDVLEIHVEGILVADYTKDINIAAEVFMVMGKKGYFEMGTPRFRYTRKGTITLKGSDETKLANPFDNYKVLMVMDSAEVSIHGETRTSWTFLNATAPVGANRLTLAEAVDWRVGDEIMVTSTGIETTGEGKRFDYNETEVRKITAISTNRRTITLDSSLRFTHFGKLQTYSNGTRSWVLDERAEVGLLSRNLVIRGDDASLTTKQGGHIMSMPQCTINIAGAELRFMGQEGRLRRYPFHWHVAGNVRGQYFKNNVVRNCFNRAVTVHGTQYAVVEDNVVYKTQGHAIFLEDGNETNNIVKHNLVAVVVQPPKNKALLPSDTFFQGNRIQGPAAFWISNPNNNITNNAACGAGTGFWNSYANFPGGDARSYIRRAPFLPIISQDTNRAHACYVGLDFDFTDNTNRTEVISAHYFNPNQKVRYFTGFKNYRSIWFRGQTMEFLEFAIGDDEGRGSFISTFDGKFTNGLAVGKSENASNSTEASFATSFYDGVETITNCHFVNWNGNSSVFLMFGGAGKNLPHIGRQLTFDNSIIYEPYLDNHFSPQISFLEDQDGTVTGNPGWWITTEHPFIIDNKNFPPIQPGYKGRKTPFRFGRLRVAWETEERKSVLYYEYEDEHIAHTRPAGNMADIPLMLDGGKRKYMIRFTDSIPLPLRFIWDEVKVGDEAFFRFAGMPEELLVSNAVKVNSLAALEASRVSAYAYINGEMHFHIIATQTLQSFTLQSRSGRGLSPLQYPSRPYKNTPRSVNSNIQAEHFDYGGQNAAYFEDIGKGYILGNTGYDVMDVRPAEILDFTKIDSLNYALFNLTNKEWVKYTINVPSTGLYKLEINSRNTGEQLLDFMVDSISLGRFRVPGGVSYKVSNLGNIQLTKGIRVITIKAVNNSSRSLRIDWFRISRETILPIVNLITPTTNAVFTATATIALRATASSPSSIARVEFFNGNTKLGEDLTTPFTFTWTGVNVGRYSLTARATDIFGNTTISTAVGISVVQPNILPTVTITSPLTNTTFRVPYNLTITAFANDRDGYITKVEFYNGNVKVGEDQTFPYALVLNNITAGSYNFRAQVTDEDGGIGISNSVLVTVQLLRDCASVLGGTARRDTCGTCVGGTTGRTTLDTDGDLLPNCIDPDDDNDGIPDAQDCNPTNSSIGRATTWYADTDRDGKGDPRTSLVSCTQPSGFVSNNTDQCPTDSLKTLPGNCGCGRTETSCLNVPPVVSFISPTQQAIVAIGSLTVTVTAFDSDGTISGVALYYDNTLVRTSISAPYTWGRPGQGDVLLQNVSLGNHTLRAEATDNNGAKTIATITITGRARDCASVLNGTAYLDTCGVCVGGTTGRTTLDTDGDRLPNCIDTDDDNDGIPDAQDCNPTNNSIGRGTTWYADTDRDGKGDPNSSLISCTQPSGFVSNNTDQCPNDSLKTLPGNCGCGRTETSCLNRFPTVSFQSPTNQAIVAVGSLTVTAVALDSDGSVTGVALYFDNVLVRTSTTSPYTWGVNGQGDVLLQNISLGSHTLRAEATDNKGAKAVTTITIIAKNRDCARVIDGTAYLDTCGVCVGGTTGRTTQDNDGDQIPDCVDTDDDNDGVLDSLDCNSLNPQVLGKSTWYADQDGDGYGDLSVDSVSCTQPVGYVLDSEDECPYLANRQNSGDCGCYVPEGSCFDCKGIPFGTALLDSCQRCVTSISQACARDCAGIWGGSAALDSCRICSGGTTGLPFVTDPFRCVLTTIAETSEFKDWMVIPNPSASTFSIYLPEYCDVLVMNPEGKIIYSRRHMGHLQLGENFNSGMYVMTIRNSKELLMYKLIKQ